MKYGRDPTLADPLSEYEALRESVFGEARPRCFACGKYADATTEFGDFICFDDARERKAQSGRNIR